MKCLALYSNTNPSQEQTKTTLQLPDSCKCKKKKTQILCIAATTMRSNIFRLVLLWYSTTHHITRKRYRVRSGHMQAHSSSSR